MFSFKRSWGGRECYIVLDSNVLYNDFWMEGAGFRTLRSILSLVNAQVLLPRVVIAETINNFRQLLMESLRATQRLERVLNRRVLPELEVEAEVARYRDYLKELFLPPVLDDPGPSPFARLPYPKVNHSHVVKRLLGNKKPFRGGSNKEQGYRDLLVWLSVVAVAKKAPEAKVIFVSENIKDFAVGPNDTLSLHPDLLADLPRGRQVNFYRSLGNLLADLLAELGGESHAFLSEHPGLLDRLGREIVPQLLDRWLELFVAPSWNDGRVYEPLGPDNVVVELRKVTSLNEDLTAILLDASYWPRWFYEGPDDSVSDNSTTVAVTLQLTDSLEVLTADVEGDALDLPANSAAPVDQKAPLPGR